MATLLLTPEEVEIIYRQIDANAGASQRFKRLSAIAWRDAAIVSLLFLGLTSKEICDLCLADLKFGKLIVNPKWGGRRNVDLDANTRKYLDHYLEGTEERMLIFLSQRGKVLNVRTIERMISKLGDQVDIPLVPSRLTISASKESDS